MNKLQLDPPLGAWAAPRYVVRVQRQSRSRTPWSWAICEEGKAEPCRQSTRLYCSADEAWVVGRAVLERLGPPTRHAALDTNASAGPL
jgi:hypothetical protein